ncbi:hypothetical protein ABZ530_12940, partial [Micrococcus luteus]|uniref:carbohydrate ABC transporter permease n=1 Tax=Micrococcus luteus TaxID=1270 RepID=UPI00346CE253
SSIYNLFDALQWIGFDNFSEMFGDPRWRHSVQVTLWYVAVGTPLKLLAALGVALLLAQSRRGQAFYRAAFYAPSLIGASVSVAIVWKAIFSDDAVVDRTQKLFGIDVGGWTGDPDMIIYSLVALTVALRTEGGGPPSSWPLGPTPVHDRSSSPSSESGSPSGQTGLGRV